MGRFGYLVNAWASIWTLFVSIIFILPTFRPVKANEMNYASAFLVLILLSALIYWFIAGKRFYTGPLMEAEIVDDGRDSSSGEHDLSEKADVA